MGTFYKFFIAYLRFGMDKVKWFIIFILPFFVLFIILHKKGYVKTRKKVTTITAGLLLSLNCSFIFVMTLFGRTIKRTHDSELIPFKSYTIGFLQGDVEMILQIVMNVVMYLPLGFLLPYCFELFEKYRNLLFMIIVSSSSIELIQYIFKLGLFETDDIINNVLGSTIGLLLYRLYCNVKVEMTLRTNINDSKK